MLQQIEELKQRRAHLSPSSPNSPILQDFHTPSHTPRQMRQSSPGRSDYLRTPDLSYRPNTRESTQEFKPIRVDLNTSTNFVNSRHSVSPKNLNRLYPQTE